LNTAKVDSKGIAEGLTADIKGFKADIFGRNEQRELPTTPKRVGVVQSECAGWFCDIRRSKEIDVVTCLLCSSLCV
jgi:hypothetical protein